MKVFDLIVNRKNEQQIYTGIIATISPLTFKFHSDDTAIPCVSTTSLTGIDVGSNVVMVKIGSKFIAIAVIG